MKTITVVTLFLLVIYIVNGTPCTRKESVDISTGVKHENDSIIYDGVEYISGRWYEAEEGNLSVVLGCPCIGRVCLWKCCGIGQAHIGRECQDTRENVVNPFNPPVFKGSVAVEVLAYQHFFYMFTPLCDDRYLVDSNLSREEIYIQEVVGEFMLHSHSRWAHWPRYPSLTDDYLEMYLLHFLLYRISPMYVDTSGSRRMGLIQSIFCSITFCVERVLTWTCCAFLLMLLMFSIIMLMVYGIAVGYNYAQKELASFAMSTKTTTEEAPPLPLRSGPDTRPVVRLVAVNRSEVEQAPHPLLEVYQTKNPGYSVYMESIQTPVVVLETERPPREPELSPRERELARRLIGRFRRSRNNTSTSTPFLRPLRNASNITQTLSAT